MSGNVVSAYCLFDEQANSFSATGLPLTWGMMVSDDGSVTSNGFADEIQPEIKSALEAIGCTEDSDAYYSVPMEFVCYLPHDKQLVIDAMNEKLVHAGIQDVIFTLMSNNTPTLINDNCYLVQFGYIVDTADLNDEGKETAKTNDGLLCDIEDENGGDISLHVKKLNEFGNETFYLIGGEAVAANTVECDLIFEEIMQSNNYQNAVKLAYEAFVGTDVPEFQKRVTSCSYSFV